ncbi:MAG: alpha/beta fold hydrolase [Microthrixaceae bacterium]
MARVDFDRVTFPGSRGVELAGRLDLPSREPRASAHHIGEPRAFALFAHCFTCGKDVVAASRISGALAREGIAVLRFDFTGLGSSEGDFSNTDFSSNVDDLVAAADMLRSRYAAPSLLIGHSLGGAAALVAAHRVPELTAVVTIAAPSDPEHVAGLLGPETLGRISDAGSAEVTLAGRRFTIRSGFIEDVRARTWLARSRTWERHCCCCTHPPTGSSGSSTQPGSTGWRGTPRASWPSTVPTTCSPSRRCAVRGQAGRGMVVPVPAGPRIPGGTAIRGIDPARAG